MEAIQPLPARPNVTTAHEARPVAYWVVTGLLAFGMISGGTGQVVRAKFNVDGIIHLGYPVYALTIIGLWKLAGIVVVLLPRRPLAKEWAYAGLFFLLSSAAVSHPAAGDGALGALPAFTFTRLTAASWALRPPSRRLAAA
jgi:hypothetical protein